MEWKRVETQSDADNLLDAFGGFHDGCLHELHLWSGYSVNSDFTSGTLKIVDFGVAQRLPPGALIDSVPTTTTTVVGTFPYMAPEVLRGERPDPRSDIFSAGAVLYEMATGCRAFPRRRCRHWCTRLNREKSSRRRC